MAYEIGTAANYLDLLDRLRLFVTDPNRSIESAGMDISELDPIPEAAVWTVKRWNPNWDGAGEYELILAGPGVSGLDDILVGVQTWRNAAAGGYNWCLNGFTGFSQAASFFQQAGSRSSSKAYCPQVLLNNTTMQYWFFANGRRICGVAKVAGTYYASFYLGYILPYGTPAAFPYPLLIGGSSAYDSTSSYQVYSTNWLGNRGFTDPAYDNTTGLSSSCIFLSGSWLDFGNYTHTSSTTPARLRNVWPYIYGTTGVSPYANYLSVLCTMDPAGNPVLFPLVLSVKSGEPSQNVFGEMHGVYMVWGQNIVAEDTVTIDGETYIAFQNGRFTGSQNFFAIKKE